MSTSQESNKMRNRCNSQGLLKSHSITFWSILIDPVISSVLLSGVVLSSVQLATPSWALQKPSSLKGQHWKHHGFDTLHQGFPRLELENVDLRLGRSLLCKLQGHEPMNIRWSLVSSVRFYPFVELPEGFDSQAKIGKKHEETRSLKM